MQRSNLGMRKGYHLSIEGIRKGYLFCLKSWFVQLQTNSFQGLYKDFSRTNDSFKIYLINRHSLPPLIILLAKRPGVIYDFHYFGHLDHIISFIPLSATRLCKMTGYDLQLHLRYRDSICNKETEI